MKNYRSDPNFLAMDMMHRRAVKLLKMMPVRKPLSLATLNLVANEYMNNKLFDRAEALLELAYSIGREQPFHPDARLTLSYYEKLFLLTDRQAEVEDMRSWLRPIHPKLIAKDK